MPYRDRLLHPGKDTGGKDRTRSGCVFKVRPFHSCALLARSPASFRGSSLIWASALGAAVRSRGILITSASLRGGLRRLEPSSSPKDLRPSGRDRRGAGRRVLLARPGHWVGPCRGMDPRKLSVRTVVVVANRSTRFASGEATVSGEKTHG
jgi:hypothetical protein